MHGRCVSCGYDLRGNISGTCPECGSRLVRLARLPAIVLLTSGTAVGCGDGPRAQVALIEDFDRPALDEPWTIDVSPGNTITLRGGAVEISAAENTYAHIDRSLGVDHVRAACRLRAGSGISWCTSLFLYWKPGDWCQIGVIPRGDGRYYVCQTTGAQRDEHDLTRCRVDAWHHVAIELGQDCVRYLTSEDGRTWRTELFLPRPPGLMGPPALLIVGKGFGLDASSPDLDNDYGERGAVAVSLIDDVIVTPIDPARMRITAEERRAAELANADPLGAAILALDADADFDTVAAKLPPLAKPREVVGVKDHPYEIGVEYDGTIQLADDTDSWEQTGDTAWFEVGSPPVRFGAGRCSKRLVDGYLPIVEAAFEHAGVRYTQSAFGWSEGQLPDKELWAYVRLRATAGRESPGQTAAATLRFKTKENVPAAIAIDLKAPPSGTAEAFYRIPSPLRGRTPARVDAVEFDRRFEEVRQYWTKLLNSGMQIDVSEPRVNDAYRAWLAYNYLNVDKKGGRYEIHDGGGFYESIFGYSAVLYCNALDLWGRHEDARRYIETMVAMVRPDGLFFETYGLPDHGGLLLALAEHYRLTGDADWLRRQVPTIVRMCDWIVAAKKETMQFEGDRKLVTCGLIRFTPYADYPNKAVNYYADAYCCTGMERAAWALAEAGLKDEAGRIATDAAAYRADILASMDAAVIERDGMKLLPMEPETQRLLKAKNYRCGDYYGLVASMFLESEFLAADDPRARLVTDGLERRRGLILGMCEFDGGVDHAYTYGYWLNCLRRNDVRRVLLGFYGTLAYGMGRDTYCGVEVTQLHTGEPTPTMPHTYSGTQQLRMLRMMLVQEDERKYAWMTRPDEFSRKIQSPNIVVDLSVLTIARGVPRHWLEDGKRVIVKNAPTIFGPLSYTIESHIADDRVDITINPPTRRSPFVILVSLRHPWQKPIRGVEADAELSPTFDGAVVGIQPDTKPMKIVVTY